MTEPRYGPSLRFGADAGPRFRESEDARQRRKEREKALEGENAFWAEYYRRAKLREERREYVNKEAGWSDAPHFANRYTELLDNLARKPPKKGKR